MQRYREIAREFAELEQRYNRCDDMVQRKNLILEMRILAYEFHHRVRKASQNFFHSFNHSGAEAPRH